MLVHTLSVRRVPGSSGKPGSNNSGKPVLGEDEGPEAEWGL